MVTSIFPLTIKDAVVQFRGKRLLDELSAQFWDRGTTVIIGPNGAGKTTLLKMIHGLARASGGEMVWNCDTAQARKAQSFVFQRPIVLRRTVLENVIYPLVVAGTSRRRAKEQAREWIEKVGLTGFEHRDASRMSGGEQQKMIIARAMITKPQLLILDEPTTNLDGQSTRDIERILSSAREQGLRIIMATHDIGQARRVATDVRFLNKGKIVEEGPAALFFDDPQTREAKAFLRGDIVE